MKIVALHCLFLHLHQIIISIVASTGTFVNNDTTSNDTSWWLDSIFCSLIKLIKSLVLCMTYSFLLIVVTTLLSIMRYDMMWCQYLKLLFVRIIVLHLLLREKCPYSEFFWSLFSRIQTKYGEIWSISPYSAQTQENTKQKNSKYGHSSGRASQHSLWTLVELYKSTSFVWLDKACYIAKKVCWKVSFHHQYQSVLARRYISDNQLRDENTKHPREDEMKVVRKKQQAAKAWVICRNTKYWPNPKKKKRFVSSIRCQRIHSR